MMPLWTRIWFFRSFPILLLIYLEPCFEFIDHLTFFFNAYSGRESESEVIAECLIQYGFHFLVFNKNSNLCRSFSSVIDPFASKRIILFLNCFMMVQSESGFIGAPVSRLQINLAFASFLKGCSFSQSRTYGKEHVSNVGPVPVLDSEFRLRRTSLLA